MSEAHTRTEFTVVHWKFLMWPLGGNLASQLDLVRVLVSTCRKEPPFGVVDCQLNGHVKPYCTTAHQKSEPQMQVW